ncbi:MULTISPECIES: SRPBCC family protein [Streptomyces]|uniref:Cyclase n=1 Tax=Streptomyces virginiae TaxID=1961 RepID=A0ABQ3NP70_STRVG|nr:MULTISPECIES: SRPBCC family protein [Streptomyces]GLV92930.1 cyclase [Streptomyces lavendulae subsp. lavendulae]KOU26623.1 cyclase [Streptomyces sp. WM6349]KOV13468.1 cyclase [Streptomyces sp. XY511]KOV36687.1 cyclase [Streptomyces sp. H036]MBP2341558.1 putative membrane protein [Streptomyces virginiae]
MSQVKESIEVNVPIRTAYDQWTQFESFPQFMDAVQRIEQRSDTLTHWVTKIAGVEREFDAEITEQIPDTKVAWVTVGGQSEQSGLVTFQPIDPSHTQVTLMMDFDPEGMAENIGDKLGFVDRQVKGDLKRFKHFIEDRGSASGAWRGQV